MSVLPLAVLIVAAVAALCALLVGATLRPWLEALDRFAPAPRTRWLLALLAAPPIVGLGTLALVVGHCLVPALVGSVDDCLGQSGALECLFCVARPVAASGLAWVLALVALSRPAHQLLSSLRSVVRARRVAARLRSIAGDAAGDGVWSVPGASAFALAWPEPRICIGEEVVARLDGAQLRAVLAHEDSHLRRGDLAMRLGARLLGVFHLASTREALLSALDVAIEQRSDEDASHEVRDPLIVAQALVDVASLQSEGDDSAACGVALERRVEALCASRWQPAGRFTAVAAAASLALAGAAVYCDHHVHHAADRVARLLTY